MKLDEELWLDHDGAFQTNNEENRAERSFDADEDNFNSDHTPPSRIPSSELSNSPCPMYFSTSFSLQSIYLLYY
ncbi:hypothetical protein SLE2022_104050 [Rubroshorea leprosula]